MLTKIREFVQTVFKNKYSTMVASALIAHLGIMVIIVNIFNLSYGIGLLFFWTYIWMVDCSKNQDKSGFTQALICGPVGWLLLPDCLNPVALRKSYEADGKKTRLFWVKGCLLAAKISQSFHVIRSYLMQLGDLESEITSSTSANPTQASADQHTTE